MHTHGKTHSYELAPFSVSFIFNLGSRNCYLLIVPPWTLVQIMESLPKVFTLFLETFNTRANMELNNC